MAAGRYGPMERMSDADVGARFAAQMLGVEISDEPPPPDSPLGRLLALEEQRPVTPADVAALRDEGQEGG